MRWKPRRRRLMLVTGANGFLGRHLTVASKVGEWELLAPSSKQLDVRNRDRVVDEIVTWRPNVVVHLAYRRDERRTIVDGSRNVAEAAALAGSRLVHLSTDLVFAGRPRPYVETDTPDATAEYGRWKAEAERVVADACPTALLLRTSLLYGTDRLAVCQVDVESVVHGRSVMFFVDEFRCPAHAADVAAAIVTLADRHDVSGPLHVAGPRPVSRADLARAFAVWMGADPSTVPVGSLSEAGLDRPGILTLDSSAAAALGVQCRPVEEALAR